MTRIILAAAVVFGAAVHAASPAGGAAATLRDSSLQPQVPWDFWRYSPAGPQVYIGLEWKGFQSAPEYDVIRKFSATRGIAGEEIFAGLERVLIVVSAALLGSALPVRAQPPPPVKPNPAAPTLKPVAPHGVQGPFGARLGFLGARLPLRLALLEDHHPFFRGFGIGGALDPRHDDLEILEGLHVRSLEILRLEPALGVRCRRRRGTRAERDRYANRGG